MARKNFTIPVVSLERYLRSTVAHLPPDFEIVSVALAPRGHVKLTIEESSVPEGEAEREATHHSHPD